MRIRPLGVLAAYIAIIFVFAAFYSAVPGVVQKERLDFLDALYFSIVTITTLGYV